MRLNIPHGHHAVKKTDIRRGSVLWLALRKSMPSFVGRRRLPKRHVPRFMIDPESRPKRVWDLVLTSCVFYTTCVVPYRVCFRRDAEGGFVILETAIDIAFLVDIVLNFFTGVHLSSGEISFNSRIIICTYLKGWFGIDFLSSIPFDNLAKWFHVNGTSTTALLSTKLLKGLKALRLFKLARIRRVGKMFSSLEEAVYTNQSLISLAKLAMTMLFLSHLVACIWFAVGSQGDQDSWIIDLRYSSDLENRELLEYIISMYWAIVTMATIGYGDVVARSNNERLVSIAVMALGVSFFGYVIGTISTLVTNLDVAAALYEERMTIVKEYIISRRIPRHMSKRIRAHFEYYYQNRSVFKERRILQRLPSALRNEMIHHVYSKLVSSIKYFEQCHESLISDIVMAMNPFSVLKDEYVFVQHEIAAHVFFLLKGKIHLTKTMPPSNEEKRLAAPAVGEHFGELEVYDHEHGNGVRICSAVAKSYCELTFLSREAIIKISNSWPEVIKHFKDAAATTSKFMKRRVNLNLSENNDIFRDDTLTTTMMKSSAIATKTMREQLQPGLKVSNRIAPFDDRQDRATDDQCAQPMDLPTNSTDTQQHQGSSDTQSNGSNFQVPHHPPITPKKLFVTGEYFGSASAMFPARARKSVLESLSPTGAQKRTMVFNDLTAELPEGNEINDSFKQSAPHVENGLCRGDVVSDRYQPSIPTVNAPTTQSTSSFRTQSARRLSSIGDTQRELRTMIAKIRESHITRPKSNINSERVVLKGTYIFHPQDPFILTWQFIVGIGIFYSIIVVPLRLGFEYDAKGFWLILEYGIDCFFLVDIVLNFRTAYFDDDRRLIFNSKVIFWRYAKGWFLLDFISTIPFDEVVSAFVGPAGGKLKYFPTKLLRLVRIARLLKLTRLIKLSRVFGRVREIVQLSPTTERSAKLLLLMSLFCHWNACSFHAAMLSSEGAKLRNWCADLFFPEDITITDCTSKIKLLDRYIAAMYWAFTTLTTVGYGDVKPSLYSFYELSLVIFLIVVNATLYGYIISSVIALIRNLDPADREYKALMTEMKDYLRDSTATTRLCANVKMHYQHNIACTSLFPEQKLFDKMAPNLRFDLARLVAGESLFAIPLITVMEDSFKGFVSYALFLMHPLCIVRGEKVCRSGGPGTEMFFVIEGDCDIVNSETGMGRIIGKNAVFEQYALMAGPDEIYRTVSTVTALSMKCVLYSFSIHDFKILEDVSPAVSTYFLSQLASVLVEDGMFTLTEQQRANVERALRKGQIFRSMAEHQGRIRLKDIGKVAMAKLYPRRGSEWSPDLLFKQLQRIAEKSAAANVIPLPTGLNVTDDNEGESQSVPASAEVEPVVQQ